MIEVRHNFIVNKINGQTCKATFFATMYTELTSLLLNYVIEFSYYENFQNEEITSGFEL